MAKAKWNKYRQYDHYKNNADTDQRPENYNSNTSSNLFHLNVMGIIIKTAWYGIRNSLLYKECHAQEAIIIPHSEDSRQ